MRVFKTNYFRRWASREGVADTTLWAAVEEMERGLIDADLGGGIYKKRIALSGRGKRGGARTLLVYQAAERAFFAYGFTKKDRANVSPDELKALKGLAKALRAHSNEAVTGLVEDGNLFEVTKE